MFGKKAKLTAFREKTGKLRQEVYLQKVLAAQTLHNPKKDDDHEKIAYLMGLGNRRQKFDYLLAGLVYSLSDELDTLSGLLEKGDYKPVEEFLVMLVESASRDSIHAYDSLHQFLAQKYETSTQPIVGTPLQDSFLEVIIERNCTFIQKSAETGYDGIGENLKQEFAEHALLAKKIYDCDFEKMMFNYVSLLEELRKVVVTISPHSKLNVPFRRKIPKINGFAPLVRNRDPEEAKEKVELLETAAFELKQLIAQQKDWSDLGMVIAHYHEQKKNLGDSDYFILGVHPLLGPRMFPAKPEFRMNFSELIGYESQKADLRKNTEKLLDGHDCNHVLIHGPQGTGKSSMINALLTEYAHKGLRVLQLRTGLAPALPALFKQMGKTEHRYIVLIDEFEIGDDLDLFNTMKQVIEGSFLGFPSNAKLYVISNDDKCAQLKFDPEEVANKKRYRALEDRFGLVVEFPNPGNDVQEQILKHYLGKYEVGKSPDSVWSDFQSYCSHRDIEHPNPRNIRDFVKTL